MDSAASPQKEGSQTGSNASSEESELDLSSFAAPSLTAMRASRFESLKPEKQDSWELFYQEDLVWPDPTNKFDKTSGIKPMVLNAELQHLNPGMDDRPKNRCEKALMVTKRPRPREVPWNVVIVKPTAPIVYDESSLEEFLVHDNLFVEFFNAFLSLPCFPEPIVFNVDTGGFEVVSEGKKKLAAQIKEAVRSQNLTAKMYRVARQHAFSEMPLIPIEDSGGPVEVKIETTFPVTTLNKEQGIQWVKKERLSIFLESDYYFQYRLAKIISQAKLFNENGEYVVMKIDYTSKPKSRKKIEEVPPPNQEDLIMKEMYVSFGDTRGASKESWFTQAKEAMKTEPTFTTLGTKMSSQFPSSPAPSKNDKNTVFRSNYFGVYSPGLIGPGEKDPPVQDENSLSERMYSRERPFTPRPSDRIHAATTMLRTKLGNDPCAEEEMIQPGKVVFVWPKSEVQQTDSESGFGEMDDGEDRFEKQITAEEIINQIYNDGSWEEGGSSNIVLRSIDELGSVIVGAVMKHTLATMLDMDEKAIAADPAISRIYPSEDLCCLSMDKLDLCVVAPERQSEAVTSPEREALPEREAVTTVSEQLPEDPKVKAGEEEEETLNVPEREPVHIKWKKKMVKAYEEDSEADSLLDSDEDFEDRDIHFRRNRHKWHNLNSLKGIMAFKKFLAGTPGEKFWELWIDIDKGRLISSEAEKLQYNYQMRDKYYKKGSPFELSTEDKKGLGLDKQDNWCPEYLSQIQAKVLEPLVLYWAPRYLLKHLMRVEPEKHYLYNQMRATMPIKESDPHPHSQALLPLRPKSCCPRIRTGPLPEELGARAIALDPKLGTSPKVGNRRVYGEDTWKRLALTPTAKFLKPKPQREGVSIKSATLRTRSASTSGKLLTPIGSARKSKLQSTPGDAQPRKASKPSIQPLAEHKVDTSEVISQPVPSLVGVQPGLLSKHSMTTAAKAGEAVEPLKTVASVKEVSKRPCPNKPLEILGDIGPDHPCNVEAALGPIKKPKDLLTPMLKIVDGKGEKSKRIETAPIRRLPSHEPRDYTFYRQDSQDSTKDELFGPSPFDGVEGIEEGTIAEMKESDFLGSERMEFLLQALHHERDSGRTFRKYIARSEREDWMNNLEFWERVQDYRKLFYKDKLDLHLIAKQAKSIFAQFIVQGAPSNIGVSESVELSILDHLSPAYEDLFDEPEEHALKMLFVVFQCYLNQDVKTYCKVEREESTRRLETRNTYILNLQKQGIIKERPITPDDPMEGYIDPVFDESVLERIPAEFRDLNLYKFAQNPVLLESFRNHLANNFADIDLKCWVDIEAWRRTPPDDAAMRDLRAKEIKKNYLNKKYFFGPGSPASPEGQNRVMQVGGGWGKYLDDKPHCSTILEAQKFVRARIEKKHLPIYLASDEFKEKFAEQESVSDELDDLYQARKRRGQAVAKLMETKWQATLKEVFTFSKALQNPITRANFMNFISFRGDFLENDVRFWSEVQKYKVMHHSGADDAMIQQKVATIVNCFFESPIPPSLQIDVPPEVAERVLEHKHERGPYLFREAQAIVFKELASHWQAYRAYKSEEGASQKVLKTLERHRLIASQKEREHFEEVARQREKERQEMMERLAREQEAAAAAAIAGDHPAGEEDDLEGKEDTLKFSYSEYLASQQEEARAAGLADSEHGKFEDIATQTYRMKGDHTEGPGSRQGSAGSQRSVGSGASDKENTPVRPGSGQREKRRSSEVSGLVKRGETREPSNGSQKKVKKHPNADHPLSPRSKSGPDGVIKDLGTAKSKHSQPGAPVVKTEMIK